MRKLSRWAAVVSITVAGLAANVGMRGSVPGDNKNLPGLQAKLDETLDTAYTKAGDKIVAVLQEDTAVGDVKLPKGSKLTGTVMRAVKQDKQHANSGLVLLFNSVAPKNGVAVPVHVAIVSLAPSHSDEIEKVDVGSGDVTDASLAADVAAGVMDDSNDSATAHTATTVNGVKVVSAIKGVVLFASPNGSSSGVVVARKGPLQLEKWTRLGVILSGR